MKNPFTYKLDYGLKCFLKKEQKIDKCITELYNFIKNDMKVKMKIKNNILRKLKKT